MSFLLACDQSVRGFAIAVCSTDWGGDWEEVRTFAFDGGKVSRGDDNGALDRLWAVYHWVIAKICYFNPSHIGFESYGFSANPDVHVVELVGALKLAALQREIVVTTVQQATARKLVAGEAKIPRKGEDAKALMKTRLVASGAPPDLSLDETDALVVLNSMLIAHKGQPLV